MVVVRRDPERISSVAGVTECGRAVARLCALLALFMPFVAAPPAAAAADFRTDLAVWRAVDGGFAGWERSGVALRPDGRLELADDDGEATSPATPTAFGAAEAIPSWNVDAPSGGWVEVLLRARLGQRWTGWYAMGAWAA